MSSQPQSLDKRIEQLEDRVAALERTNESSSDTRDARTLFDVGDTYELVIESLTEDGKGFGWIDGVATFVTHGQCNLVPSDHVMVRVTNPKERAVDAIAVEQLD